jgi:glycosyltransferase involved in cell wall biosynthesis
VSEPLTSIIMPTFNRLAWLRAAVRSVFEQTLADWELIIADDGSEEATREYLRALAATTEHRVRVLLLTHGGNPPVTRNIALAEARGEYVAFLDSDDLWLPRKLEMQIASLGEHPLRAWSYTRSVLINGSGQPLEGERALHYPADRDGWIAESLLRGEARVTQSSVLARRDAIADVGGYPEDLPICGDYELYLRLALRSEIDFVDEPLVLVRRHTEHYCDDLAALSDLGRFMGKVQRSGMMPHMRGVLRARRARILVGLTREWLKSRVRGLGFAGGGP